MPERDMSEPVTRGEMHGALETWAGAIITRIEARMDERFAQIHERFAQVHERFAQVHERFAQVHERFGQVHVDLARHAKAIQETLSSQIAIIDERYADLPARVGRLERTVYKRTKRASATRSRTPRRR